MKKTTIWLLTIIMVITFTSLLYMQLIYTKNVVELRDEQFTQGVKRSLNAVSRSLELAETKQYLLNDMLQSDMPAMGRNSFTIMIGADDEDDSGLGSMSLLPGKSWRERIRDQYTYKRALLDEVVLSLISQSNSLPIQERADSALVSDMLKTELASNGITLPFEFAVVNRMGAVVYKTHNYNVNLDNDRNTFVQVLFPSDSRARVNYLKVYFPDKRDYLIHSIKVIIPSMILTIILLVMFIYTIIVAFRQKKLTEMKNDFINNMTHEFKTPISSISLAAQMLNDNSVRKSPKMLEHISGVINDETKRLRFQVEKVLQMSMFNNQKATLRLQEVDANSVIQGIINTFKLKVERYGGQLNAELNAEDAIIAVDEMHFTNVIFNLLDNAVKYRDEERPLQLSVSTADVSDSHLQIVIADNGIGIRKDDLKRIFDKFYRVSTGNRHDVKGFGLGLAYVKKMVNEFDGEITAESELGKETKFIIKLPLTKI